MAKKQTYLEKIQAAMDENAKQTFDLEKDAGIFEPAEALRAAPPPYHMAYNLEKREMDDEYAALVESDHYERTNKKIEELYAAVSDPSLRNKLTALDSEWKRLSIRRTKAYLDEARTELHRRELAPLFSEWEILINSAFFGGLGYAAAGLMGALIGLVAFGIYFAAGLEPRKAMKAKLVEEQKGYVSDWEKRVAAQ